MACQVATLLEMVGLKLWVPFAEAHQGMAAHFGAPHQGSPLCSWQELGKPVAFGKFGLYLKMAFGKLGLNLAAAWNSGMVDWELIPLPGKTDLESQVVELDMAVQCQGFQLLHKVVLLTEEFVVAAQGVFDRVDQQVKHSGRFVLNLVEVFDMAGWNLMLGSGNVDQDLETTSGMAAPATGWLAVIQVPIRRRTWLLSQSF